MKRLLLPLLLCTSSFALAAPPEFTYRGLPWYSSPAKATAYLKSRNWDEVLPRKTNTRLYRQHEGIEGGFYTLVTSFKDGRLDAVYLMCEYDLVTFKDALLLYKDQHDEAVKKLGKPVIDFAGKPDDEPHAAWNRPGGAYQIGVMSNGVLFWDYLSPSRAGELLAAPKLR